MKRHLPALAVALALLPAAQAIAETIPIEVQKTNGCGCCLSWMKHLEENGFAPKGEDMFGGFLCVSNSTMAYRSAWSPAIRS